MIEFTPDQTGNLPFNCGMGMLRGNFLVTDSGTATQNEINSIKPQSSGGSCSMSSGGGCGCGMMK